MDLCSSESPSHINSFKLRRAWHREGHVYNLPSVGWCRICSRIPECHNNGVCCGTSECEVANDQHSTGHILGVSRPRLLIAEDKSTTNGVDHVASDYIKQINGKLVVDLNSLIKCQKGRLHARTL